MVLCINCKFFRITSRLEGDMCTRMNEIISDNFVYDDAPCDLFEPDKDEYMDSDYSEI